MKLVNVKDWKSVHFQDRTILRSDRNLFSQSAWLHLLTLDVRPLAVPGHYKVILSPDETA